MSTFKSIQIVLLLIALSACGDFWYTDVQSNVGPTSNNPATGNPSNPNNPNIPNPPHVMAWHHPISLTDTISVTGTNATLPKVAMNQDNNAIVVWEQSDGVRTQIFKSEYRDGVWTHPSSLSDNISPDQQFAFWPEVAMDNNGNAIVVWRQGDSNANYQIFKSEYRNGVWTHPANLNDNISPDGSNAYNAQIAMSDNGEAVITWYQSVGAQNQIFMSEYRNGAWTHPSSLADYISLPSQQANANQVAMDASGNTIIVWHQSNGIHNQIFKSEYRNGAWTHPTNLNDNISPNGQHATQPYVVMNDMNESVITWQQSDGVFSQIFKSEYRNGAWTHPANLNDNISPNGQHASNARVALNLNAEAVIVWQQSDGGLFTHIYKSEYRNNIWTHPVDLADYISPAITYGATNPKVALSDEGETLIVWEQRNGPLSPSSYYEIFKSEYRNGAWTHPSGLSDNISPDGTNASAPEAAISNEGLILWVQSNGLHQQIYLSHYR